MQISKQRTAIRRHPHIKPMFAGLRHYDRKDAQFDVFIVGDSGALLPPLSEVKALSKAIAYAVAKQAQKDGVALGSSDEAIRDSVERNFWFPRYRRYRRAAF